MSFTELSEQEIIRRNSLNELAKLGIEAYPAPEFQVNAHAAEIKERFDETAEPRNVVIAGRMMSRRIMGKASFFELQDATGRIQVYVSRDDISTDEASTAYNTVFKKLMDIGDIVGVKDKGYLLQLNLLSLSGYYGKQVMKNAETLLEKGMYDMVGTDLHNLDTFGKWIGNVRLTDKLAREIMSLR